MRFKCQIGEGPPLLLLPQPETLMVRRAPPAPVPAVTRPCARQRRVPTLSRVGAAVLLAAAVGCATPEPKATKAWTIEPLIGVTHAMQAGEAYYTLGRYHDGAQEWGKAALAYRKAIAADAQNIEARNALGVALARTGRLADAEAALREAVALAPDRAHVRNNLGYVLLLAGKPAAAVVELRAALTLDAGDTVVRANLSDALARSDAAHPGGGGDAPAERPAPPAAVVRVAEAAAPPLLTVSVPAPITEVELPVPLPQTSLATPPAAALQSMAPVAQQAAVAATLPPRPPRLEISNGNGVAGMAAKVGRWLVTHQGVRADRLTNQKPFVQRDTIVQYSEGHAEAAARIARALPLAAQPATEPSKGLPSGLRVVLGRDWARSAACLDRGSCPARDAATTLASAQGTR
jgi:tetratricopeptide (TPR) repeat protein